MYQPGRYRLYQASWGEAFWKKLKLDPESSGFDLDLIQSEPIRNEQDSTSTIWTDKQNNND